jgi:hypothetical protein
MTMRLMTPLSPELYLLACHLAKRSAREEGLTSVSFPLATVIHAATSLEAFINEELEHSRAHRPEWSEIYDEFERDKILPKWLVLAKLLCGKTFDKGREPFQSFKLLIDLRNGLVHYKPKYVERARYGELPSFAKPLGSHYAFSELASDRIHRWEDRVLNYGCARWACETNRAMVVEWYRLTAPSLLDAVDETYPPSALPTAPGAH